MKAMTLETIGKIIVVGGLAIVALGGCLWLMGRLGLSLGHLPGDIAIERQGLSVYVPIATTLLLSLGLTLVVNVVLWVLRK